MAAGTHVLIALYNFCCVAGEPIIEGDDAAVAMARFYIGNDENYALQRRKMAAHKAGPEVR